MRFKNPRNRQKFHIRIEKDWLSKIMEWLLYFGCFFPFIKFIIYIGSDTQPTGLLAALLIVVAYGIQNRKTEMTQLLGVVGAVVALAGALAVFGRLWVNLYDTLRSYFGYISLLIIPLGTYLIFKQRGGPNERLIKIIIWVWFAAGFIQKYIDSSFLENVLSRYSTNEARGVVGMGSEPSAYGYMCLFMILLVMKFEKNRWLYIANLLIQIVVFAQSTVTLLYLAVYIGMYLINELVCGKKYALLKFVVLAGGGAGGLVLISNFARQGSRMQVLVWNLFHKPEMLLEDGSITLRVQAIEYSITEFIANYGMPHGLSKKIMSGIGTVLYEFGIFGIILVVLVAAIIWLGYPKGERITYTGGFLIMMFSSIPFAAPIVSFYLGWCLYQRKLRIRQNRSAAGEVIRVDGKRIIRRRAYESSVDM